MHRIDSPNALPGGFFTEGDPLVPVPATEVSDDWLNATQEEIAAVIAAAGIELNKADNGQLRKAIQALIDASLASYGVGTVLYVPATSPPHGFVKSNGALLSRTAYATLWAYAQVSGNVAASDAAWIAGKFSPGDGATTFRIPDLRGEFVRGWDDGRGVDMSRILGSKQDDEYKAHTHGSGGNNGFWVDMPGRYISPASGSIVNLNNTTETTSSGGVETRPRNVALMPCIKY
jgi:microcystin-dependent protein